MYWKRFAAECEAVAAGMRISTSKSEAMVLDRKRVACPLQVGGEVLPQVEEEFKYLGVLFTIMRSVYRTVVVKKELSRKAKSSRFTGQSTFPPSPMVMNFGIERSQLRWLGHLFRMPPGRLPREVFQACPTGGGGLGEDPGHAGETMSLGWPGNASGSPPEELEEVSGVREVWASLLRLLPPRPGPGPSG
ncbi:hypothetical protein L3Q82_022135 [Scortum barcoo]|uniref:Uncharacterized protein n=1 Tax=Scortum barcoo TaxID=214431 RepID=A0ACB8X0N4_9TELE|nr:hypothetical protein L3Q82_022135 [Scortum barcoo]